ncbi:MAG: hypothetical protein HUJ77_00270 [Clostridium sp.]|mgnify:CR=1 FL=1|uniref:hypothetical protein n=1 Tax=Clostridium sp. TaxID=1506 RepID=UPI0025BF581B|nr:hypothetical protein [Clostridium sp.]MCF0146809.1 hypothetical protein [Clostridium sp.]
MRRFASSLLSFVMIFTLFGCVRESHEEEIKNAVGDYFSLIKSGDYNKSMEMTNKDKGDFKDSFGFSNLDDKLLNNLINTNMGDVFNEEAESFISFVMSKSIGDYSIDKVKEKNGTAIVSLSGKCFDFTKFDPSSFDFNIEELSTKYLNEHKDELKKIYTNEGQASMNQKIIDNISPEIFDELKKDIDDIEEVEFKMEILLKNIDGQWLISNIHQVQEES